MRDLDWCTLRTYQHCTGKRRTRCWTSNASNSTKYCGNNQALIFNPSIWTQLKERGMKQKKDKRCIACRILMIPSIILLIIQLLQIFEVIGRFSCIN